MVGIGYWITTMADTDSKILDFVRQPDSQTCQAAACARLIGTHDVHGVREELLMIARRRGSSAGDPYVMGELLAERCRYYKFNDNASLNDARKALEEGCDLITHGWFTGSGHVIGISAVQPDPSNLSYKFVCEDPWAEFDFPIWAYSGQGGNDVLYSSYGIYAACVVGQSPSHARAIYDRGELNSATGGMWLHIVRN
jgi:hypothetical protein